MSTDREVTRIVRSWLEEGATVLPERVLDAVLAQVPATRQRRAWWPARRLPLLNTPMRIALAAVAVIVVAAIGIALAPKTASVGGPPATPAPTPTATPIPLPLYPQTLTVPATAPYLAGAPFPIPITVTVPAGWDGNVGGPYAAYLEKGPSPGTTDGAEVAFTLRQGLFADPCHGAAFLEPQPGPSVDDLASALVRLPAFAATTPTDVIVDGYHGKELTLAAPASFDGCTLTSIGYGLWQLPLGAVFSFLHGDRMTIRILDVGGHRLVVSSTTHPATSAQDRAEMQSILDSIHIQKPQ